jgi:hypothetical protein
LPCEDAKPIQDRDLETERSATISFLGARRLPIKLPEWVGKVIWHTMFQHVGKFQGKEPLERTDTQEVIDRLSHNIQHLRELILMYIRDRQYIFAQATYDRARKAKMSYSAKINGKGERYDQVEPLDLTNEEDYVYPARTSAHPRRHPNVPIAAEP